MAHSDIQVLIAGAGVGGLTLAGLLRRAGLEPIVVEQRGTLAAQSGAVELGPDAVALLSRLGVDEAVRDAGGVVTEWTRRRPDGKVLDRLETDQDAGIVAIEYPRLRELLLEPLPEGSVYTESGLRSLDRADDSVGVEFENGVSERFDVVVGADGVHSRTRALVGGEEPAFRGTTSVAFSAAPRTDLEGAAEIWTADGAVFRAVPADGRVIGWLTVPAADPEWDPSGFAAFARSCPEIEWLLPEVVRSVEREDVWWDADRRAPADLWARGRVGLLGDAAHARHRLTGVGATLAVEDAAAFSSALLESGDDPAAGLEAYASSRRSRLARLPDEIGPDAPLSGVDSSFADRYPEVLAVRGARLAACFGAEPPAPSVDPPSVDE